MCIPCSCIKYYKPKKKKEEITGLKYQCRQLEAEAKRLKKSSTQSRWYFGSKKKRIRSTHSGSTTPNSDTSDTLSSGFWKSTLKTQSTASSESTINTPFQSKLLSQEVADLTSPYDSLDDHGDDCGSPWTGILYISQGDQQILLNTTAVASLTTTPIASAASQCIQIATASSLTTPTVASASPTSLTSTIPITSVGARSSALPLQSSSASVIEALSSESVVQDNDISLVDGETTLHGYSSPSGIQQNSAVFAVSKYNHILCITNK